MKIAIDGYNLGLPKGTGIATYGRELSALLEKSGHEVYPIYGLNNISRNPRLSYSQFIQRVSVGEGASGIGFSRSFLRCLSGVPFHFLGIPFGSNQITKTNDIYIGPSSEKLPLCTGFLNCPSIYKASQAYSLFSGKSTKINLKPNVDLLHLTCPLPLSIPGTPKVVTLHDLIPLVLPASTEINLKNYASMIRTSLRDADAILTVSECSKTDLLNLFNISEDRVFVTYQASTIPDFYKTISIEMVNAFLRNLELRYGEYFLYYGAIEPKKNVARIIEAFSSANTDFPILIVGKDGWLYDDVKALLKQKHNSKKGRRKFRRIPYSSFRTLMLLLKGARGLVFPSLYEGFGLPVLEAMQMGCPVITSDRGSLLEVGGQAVHYVDPYDIQSISAAIDKFTDDSSYISSLIKKGFVQSNKFTDKKHLERLLVGYEMALS